MRWFHVVALALAAAATPASAGIPLPVVTAPAGIRLVGSTAGVPDPAGAFSVTVRDLAQQPMVGSDVIVDLFAAGDLDLCPTPALPGLRVNLVNHSVTGVTDANGHVDFVIMGGSHGAPSSVRGHARIFVDGILVTPINPTTGFLAAAPDLDGNGGLGANDISKLLSDLGSGSYWARADMDLSGELTANDLSVLLTLIGGAGSTESCP